MSDDEADAEDFEVPSEDAPHCRPFFAGVDSQFVYLRALQINHERLEAMFPSCPPHRQPAPRPFIGTRIALEDWQRFMTRSHMCAVLARKLVCFGGVCFMKQPLKHATMVLLRCRNYSLPIAAPAWSAWLEGHNHIVWSVAFHPSLSLLATGSYDSTVKLWLLASDGSNGTCTATLKGHGSGVTSVAFHPSLPLLASGSNDKTAKVWLLGNSDGTESTCTATLEGHTSCVWSLAFHPTLPLLASGSNDKTARVWRFDSKFAEEKTCTATLEGHADGVTCVAFHSSLPLLVAGSRDCSVSLWS